MGFLKKVNQDEKNRQKQFQEKAELFKRRLQDIGEEFGMQLVPIITKYGLSFEIQPLLKPPSAPQNNDPKQS